MRLTKCSKQISEYSQLSVNTVRVLAAEAIAAANSGHTGIALGAAPILYALFRDHLNFNPKDPFYFNRDRFVLSAGHGSALLYATMLISGCTAITMDDLKAFRQINAKTAGHPERTTIHGIEVNTGPLGQGIAMGVGLAIAEAKLASKFNKYSRFIHHHTYVLFGDGCLEEGVAQEAIALAGTLKLNNLIMLYDSNRIQLDGKVTDSTNWNVKQLFKAYDWNYIKVRDANNTLSVSRAIAKAKLSKNKPTVIECSTIIGFGSRFQNTNAIHGIPLNPTQIVELRNNLNYKIPPFTVHPSVHEDMYIATRRGLEAQRLFNLSLQKLEVKDLNLYNQYIALSSNQFRFELDWYKTFAAKPAYATRMLISDVLQPILEHNDTFFIGSADVASSTQIHFKKSIPFTSHTKDGQNINFGVREFAMTCINIGITAHGGCKCISGAFLSFSDYAKSAIRLAALSHVPIINVYTHDSLTVGEDGPTHQPVEQIPTLRLIPNHYVFRPCNLAECIVAVRFAMFSVDAPTTIIGSRTEFAQHDSDISNAKLGGYVIKQVDQHQLNIIATGSEVALAIQVSDILQAQNIKARVISMLSLELFNLQGLNYRQTILDNKPTVSIELASTAPWYKYADLTIGVDDFGKSGKPQDVINFFDLTPEKIANKIITWLKPKG